HATVFHLALGVFAIGLVTMLRGQFGGWLHAPALAAYVPGIAVAMLLERVSFMPERILARDMRFRVVGLARTAAEIAYRVTAVGLAWAGFGGMGLVWGNVVRSAVKLALVGYAVDRREWLTPSRLRWTTTKELMAFGLPFSVSASAGFAARRWDNLLISSL